MNPIKCDVFSTGNLCVDGPLTINGNLYVDGNADLSWCWDPVEIFGDVIITGQLLVGQIIVHGNLECKQLNCDSAEVDGDIYTSSIAEEVDSVTSNTGNIYITETVDALNITALNGSIILSGDDNCSSFISSIKAFDDIEIHGDLLDVNEIIAGNAINITGTIYFENFDSCAGEYSTICTHSGSIHSKNININ